MKNKLNVSVLIVFALSLITYATAYAQQGRKVEKAEKSFCSKLEKLITSFDNLTVAYDGGSMDDFNKAYNKAEKSWNKFEKAADKLEQVEIEESQKAYDNLVKSVNDIDENASTIDSEGQINDQIDATASRIADILTVVCQ